MSSIDERIVSIKFNNAQFEAGVRSTMGSLDGLKKSLNFSAGISALGDLDKAGKSVNLKLNNTGFDASVKGVVDSANNLKSNLKFDGVTRSLSDLDNAGRKVNLKLDATAFQNGAKGIVDAATTIKNNMNFESAERGFGILKSSVQNFSMSNVISNVKDGVKALGELELAAGDIDLGSVANNVENLSKKFEGLGVIGLGVLASLGAKALDAGINMAKGLLAPMQDGLREYETNMNSIQTIMANTQSKGTTMNEVNAALAELNTYSDKTIYNFSEMARNIGTFTSAGMGLKESTAAIKGISNLAALSGSNSEQASTAMYQLSQAMSTGVVKLQDWNSVVNAGMGGEVFQNALKETARNQGQNVDALIEKNGSFRDSLQEGWLTDKVMMETLSKMTGDLSREQLAAMGYNDDQIAGIMKMAETASDAATKIKTFSQLVGTIAETAGSGWSQSFSIVLGDFEEAKELFTHINDIIGKMQNDSAKARNDMLQGWKDKGGRAEGVLAVKAAFDVLLGVMTPIKEALNEVFPPDGGQGLYVLTKAICIFIQALIPGVAATALIKNSFKLLFTVIKIGLDIIKGALSVVVAFFKAFATGGDSISGSMQPLTDMLGKLTTSLANSKFVENFFTGLASVATTLGGALGRVVPIVMQLAGALYQLGYDISGYAMHYTSKFARVVGSELVSGLKVGIEFFYKIVEVVLLFVSSLSEGVDVAMTRVRERMESFGRLGDSIARMWDQAREAGAKAWEAMKPLREAISNMFNDIKNEIKNALSDVNFDDTLDVVNTGLLVGLVLLFKNFFKKITGMGNGVRDGLMSSLTGGMDAINGVLDQLTGTLSAMQANLKAGTLVKIATAIGIMALSVVVLSMIDSAKLTKALIAIGVMVKILTGAMLALDAMSQGNGFLKIPFIAASMILLAVALTILTIPVLILSRLSWNELIKGLAGVGALMYTMSKAVESMAQNPADLIATGVGLIAVAVAIRILADAVAVMGTLDTVSLIKGLGSVIIVLMALTKTVESMAANPADLIATGLGLMAVAVAVKILASAVGDFGGMDIATIIQGIIAMGLVLKALEGFTKGVGDVKGMISTAIGLVLVGVAMKVMASAIGDMGSMDVGTLAKGLTTLAISMGVISFAMAMMPDNMVAKAAGLVLVAIALKLIASAIQDMGGMSWEEIAKGLTVLAASLILIAAATMLMSGALAGAAAIFIVAAGLSLLAPVLLQLGNMSWEQIGMGMAALAAAFIVLGLGALALSPVIPSIIALGIGIALLGVGFMSFGIGVALFSVGLAAIGLAVSTAGPALILFVGSILALIPLAMTELGKGIVAFAGVIGNAAPIFLDAFTKLLMALLQAIDTIFPKLMDTLWKVITGLVSLLVLAVPLFVDGGLKIITGILTGIANNIGKLIDAATRVITEFIDGIARNLPRIIQSAANLIVSFVEGLAAAVRNNSDRMSTAGLDLAQAIIEGMANGIAKGVTRVVNAIKDMAGSAVEGAKNLLGIHSPSRVFFGIGQNVDEGFANGIDKYSSLVSDAVRGVGGSAIDTLKDTMSNIDTIVGDNVDLSPTIKPVLDLSAIKKDSSLIGGMIAPQPLSLNGTYDKAATLAVQARTIKESKTITPEEAAAANSGDSITFNQYNNSPKELSRAEIYRQTKNQLASVK